jgi:serralysin
VMTALAVPGTLPAAYFYAGSSAHDSDDHIIYDRTTGALSYDPDGNGVCGATLLATLTNKPVLLLKDFVII